MGHITCKSMGRVFGVVRRQDHNNIRLSEISIINQLYSIFRYLIKCIHSPGGLKHRCKLIAFCCIMFKVHQEEIISSLSRLTT